jgi:hypothetical protein
LPLVFGPLSKNNGARFRDLRPIFRLVFSEPAEGKEHANYTGRYGDIGARLVRSDARAPAALLTVPRLFYWIWLAIGHVSSSLLISQITQPEMPVMPEVPRT